MNLPDMLTPRLLLRSTREADGPACLDIWLDEEMGRYLADPPRALASERYLHFYEGIEQDESWYPLVALHRESGAFLGTCSAVPTEDGACWDLGYCVHRRFWRQGYGTEMVSRLIEAGRERGVRAFTIPVAEENTASNALARKLGAVPWKTGGTFRKQGTEIVYREIVYRLEVPSKKE